MDELNNKRFENEKNANQFQEKQFENDTYVRPTTNPVISEKSKIAAALLAFFLGGLGVHRFYVGKFGSGFLMLLIWFVGLFTLFIPTLIVSAWAIIDFIIILCGGFKDGKGLPIK